MHKRTQFDSSEILHRADKLMNSASNRYRITVQVANRAKRRRYEKFENPDDPMMKPVIRAIIEMSDEVTESDLINEFIEPSIEIEPPNFKRELVKISSPTAAPSPSPAPSSSPPAPPSTPSLSTPSQEQVFDQINAEVNGNPQLRQLKQEADSYAWNRLVTWISESVCKINFVASEESVKRLKHSYRDKSPREIARVLIVHKSLQAAGVDLIKGIPGAEVVIRGLTKYDLPEITKLSAEMVYQIADIYGFDLQHPDRKLEALTAFGATFLGEIAIKAGIDWLEYGLFPSKIISASAKALMLYAVGNAACLFYEAKLRSQVNPLTSPVVLNAIRVESQHYLDDATSENAVVNLISVEINTALTIDYTRLCSLLKAKEWKKADQETGDIIVKIASRDVNGSFKYLPSKDLQTINQMWVDNSNGYFSFSAQKQIYFNLSKKVGDFGEKVGWRGEAGMFGGILGWKSYSWLTFNLNKAPQGHLPAFWLDMPWWYHKGEVTRDFAESILERNDW